jgi:hypothetical protein
MTSNPRFELSSRQLFVPLRLALLGACATFLGLFFAPARTWFNLLLNGYYFLSLAVSAMFFVATQRLSGARWSASLRRIPEAFMSAMPVAALLMLPLFIGREWIYPWSRPGAFALVPATAGKVEYLRVSHVFERTAIVLFLWVLFGYLFRRISLKQDSDRSLVHHHRLNRYSAVFIVVFAFSFTASSFDWLISLEPDWFSTIYAIYVFAGCFVQGLAAITLAAVLVRERYGLSQFATEDQLHDLGRLLFAFSTFWAYIWLSQYLLIWYGNLPDEVTHYVKRTNGPWLYLFVLNFVANWALPFVMLLSQRAKRTPRVLKRVSVLLLLGRWLDLFLLIMPSAWSVPKFGVLEILIAAGYAGLFCCIFLRTLAKAPLIPLNDPLLAETMDASIHEGSMQISGVEP